MSQLKPSFVKSIYDAANSSCFTVSDFDFEFPSSGKVLAKIIFKHQQQYQLVLSENSETNTVKVKQGQSWNSTTREEVNKYTVYYLSESPGEYKLNEENEIDSINNIVSRFPVWCKNIHTDITTQIDTDDHLANFREQLENIIDDNYDDANSSFNNSEITSLEKKLDLLYTKFEDLKNKNQITEKNLKILKEEIATIKSNTKLYPKGIWAKVTNNKLIQIVYDFSKTKEGRELIIDSIKKYITS